MFILNISILAQKALQSVLIKFYWTQGILSIISKIFLMYLRILNALLKQWDVGVKVIQQLWIFIPLGLPAKDKY